MTKVIADSKSTGIFLVALGLCLLPSHPSIFALKFRYNILLYSYQTAHGNFSGPCRVPVKNIFYIVMYLIAIVAANLTVVWFGPSVSIVNAFLFIGLDLTSRDELHDAWHNNGLILKMSVLIASGSVLSWIINRDAGPVAMASFIAFGCANIADALAYHFLQEKAKLLRINGSNIISAAVDSFVFPVLAFGLPLLWIVIIGQFVAKVAGGFIWSIILNRGDKRTLLRELFLPKDK